MSFSTSFPNQRSLGVGQGRLDFDGLALFHEIPASEECLKNRHRQNCEELNKERHLHVEGLLGHKPQDEVHDGRNDHRE